MAHSHSNLRTESVQVPMLLDTMSFENRQSVGLKDMEKRVEADIKRKRKSWEKEIERMRNEFLMLYPTDRVWGSEELLNDPLVAKRRGSTDILDLKKMKTVFLDYPDVGRKFRIRFNVNGFDSSSIHVCTDGDRIIVRAIKAETVSKNNNDRTNAPSDLTSVQTNNQEDDKNEDNKKDDNEKDENKNIKKEDKEEDNNTDKKEVTKKNESNKESDINLTSFSLNRLPEKNSETKNNKTTSLSNINNTTPNTLTPNNTSAPNNTTTVLRTYERKIQKPKEVDAGKFKSYLTSDHVLIVEAPLRGRSSYHDLRRPSPASSAHFSAIGSAVGLNHSPAGSRSPSNSPGQETPSKDKIGVPTFREENGQRRLILLVDMGGIFKPQDITVQVIKDNKIWIWAKHEEKTMERLTKSKFSKEYELGEKIEIHSVTGVLAPDGRLSVGAYAKGHGGEEALTTSKSDDDKASSSGRKSVDGIKQIQSCVDLVQSSS